MSTSPPLKQSKDRASRIALDYYKRGDWLLRGKRLLGLAAAAVAIGWLGFGWLRHDDTRFSPGPLATVHASWDQQCAACHVDFVAIRSDALMSAAPQAISLANQKCQSCHPAPDHHSFASLEIASCSSCHREHQGRGAQLSRMADQSCTSCHADLQLTRAGSTVAAHVTQFDQEHHPEFRSIATDPGTLKFSHSSHLVRGLSFGPKGRSDQWKLDDLPAPFRQQYAQFADGPQGVLQLDCSACHQSDAAHRPRNPASAAPSSESVHSSTGSYMLPIRYEQHCQACHPLSFGEPRPAAEQPVAADIIPHGLSAAAMALFLERASAAQVLEKNPGLLDRSHAHLSKVPNKSPPRDDALVREQLAEKVRTATVRLGQVCAGCHMVPAGEGGEVRLPEVAEVKVPRFWLKHARFDHAAHRAIGCQECHKSESLSGSPPPWAADLRQAEPKGLTRLDNQEILIPGLAVCVSCHSPRTETETEPIRGGARNDCVECHWYHDREHSAGVDPSRNLPGAEGHRRDPTRLTIPTFLRGGADAGKSP